MRILRPIVFVLGALLLAWPVAAAPDAGLIHELRQRYRNEPTAERIEVTHRAGDMVRTETITLAMRPPHQARLEFGQLVVFVDEQNLTVIDIRDHKGYVRRPLSPAGPLATLEEMFPPFPAPQLYLAFTPPGEPVTLTPYCRNVQWQAEKKWEPLRPRTISGAGERITATLTVDDDGTTLRIASDDGRAIEVRSTPLPSDEMELTPDLTRRRPVEAIAFLVPRPEDTLPGDPLPPLQFTAYEEMELPVSPSGPGIIYFFDGELPGAETVVKAIDATLRDHPGVRYWPVLVSDLMETRLSFRLAEALARLGDVTVHYTFSPSMTSERFVEGSRNVLVVVGEDDTVRDVIPLAQEPAPDAEALAERIRAALVPPMP